MTKKSFILVFTAVLFFGIFNKTKAQISNSIAIVLNEYCVGNYVISDNFGDNSDWVEILCNHTQSVSLGGYYLSNDKNNLYKWQFPNSFTLNPQATGIVYLSGRNQSVQVGNNTFYHANFNIDQCKNQWLILTTPQGAIRDSVFVQKTKVGHTRGRVDRSILGLTGWRIYTVHSFSLANPLAGYYKDYLPMPTFTPAAGWGQNGQTLDMFLNGSTIPYDSSDSLNCYEIHYTTTGCVPTVTDPVYTYTSTALCGANAPLIILENQVFRAATFPKIPGGTCDPTLTSKPHCYPDLPNYLPSFVQTNHYFSESTGQFDQFDSRFSVMAITMDCPDTTWFRSPGVNNPEVHVEYFQNQTQWTEGYGQIHRPISESWATAQRGFYVNIDDRKGFGCNFEGNIFNDACLGTTSRTVFPTLHVHAGDYESASRKNGDATPMSANGTGIRDVFMQSLAIKYNLKVNPLHMKPMILFINGKYQGAYNLREVYDLNYSSYYKKQSRDSTYLERFHGGIDSYVNHFETSKVALPFNQPADRFRKEVYNYVETFYGSLNGPTFYNTLMSRLDKESFIDYHILNSYAMNSDIWNNNIAFGRGLSTAQEGDKWHYYWWNQPSVFNFTAITTSTLSYNSPFIPPCTSYSAPYNPSPYAGNGHGTIMRFLMAPITGNKSFQMDYKNRYQDLLNGALKCDKILAHYDCVVELFSKETKYMEDPSNPPSLFTAVAGDYDTNTTRLRKIIEKRCDFMRGALGSNISCYGMGKRYGLTVDVFPVDAGKVKLNSEVLPNYKWSGEYYPTQINLKATPTSTAYVFHHWELKNHAATTNNAPLSLDSIAVDFNQDDEILAVFTDITMDIELPTGFTPNGDGNNEVFKPLGSVLVAGEYDFRIWNRWGQEVFRTTDVTQGWNGYYESRLAQTGVYAYVITYKNIYGENKMKKGNVTLLR